ncbi:Pentachlorophenol 4-monooxygenase [Streptomyces sp. ADI96-02]|uniref:FAD-dependent monooxygenase n=1 Tax=Streptomyces sp. ADI96-02 TaxID=1522760 RepID=UPI000F556133|nr:FAD-dependent monooxygenase [Streptomyces sp. ADI96-02]RPK59668.1 Pentachlorophenol 4-monooxygenase [Streptomyces sp. ADI96-02]
MDSNRHHTSVLIAGGGPAGLVLALELARRHVDFRIIDAGTGPFPGSRGKGLQPRTLEIFDDLGIIDSVQAEGAPLPPMVAWEEGRIIKEWDVIARGEPTGSTPYAEPLMLPQSRTQELLRERLLRLGHGVAFGARLVGFSQDEAGVLAQVVRADGGTREITADYLVGADGGGSTVRRILGVRFDREEVDTRPLLVADADIPGLDREHWHTWGSAAGIMTAICPVARTDYFQVIARFAAGTPDPAPERVRELVAARTGLQVRKVLWSSVFRARAALAEHFRVGRVFLAGDSAHVHSPAGGQGINASIQDAYNLGWKLALAATGQAAPSLLDSYEAERRPAAAEVLGVSTRIHQGAGRVRELAAHRDRTTHHLALGYRGIPPNTEMRPALAEEALHAGDRAPDAPCTDLGGAPVRLFDLFRGPHFTLLVFGSPPIQPVSARGPAVIRVVRVGHDVSDPAGFASRAYAPHGLFLVRPDGYISLATETPSEVTSHLRSLGIHVG